MQWHAVTKREATCRSQLRINIIVRHTAVHWSVCMSKALNGDVSPRQGLSAHSNPAVDTQSHLPTFLNIFPKSHSLFLCLYAWLLPVPAHMSHSLFFLLCLCLYTNIFLSLLFLLHPSIPVLTPWPSPNGLKMLLQFICIYLHLKYKHSQEKLGGNVDHILYGKKWLFEDILCDVLQVLDYRKQIYTENIQKLIKAKVVKSTCNLKIRLCCEANYKLL